MNNVIVIPVGIDFLTWSQQIQQDLTQFVIPVSSSIETWWDWANQLIDDNALGNVPAATKTVFPEQEDWRKWARYFVETIYGM